MDWFKRTDNVDIMMIYVDPRNGHGLEKSKNMGRYGGFLSHGGPSIAGWFISWIPI